MCKCLPLTFRTEFRHNSYWICFEVLEQLSFFCRLQLRRYDDRPQTPRVYRHKMRALWHHLAEMNRLLPHWAFIPHVAVPRFRSRFVFVTTAALIGLYAYLRMADALSVNSSFPVR